MFLPGTLFVVKDTLISLEETLKIYAPGEVNVFDNKRCHGNFVCLAR